MKASQPGLDEGIVFAIYRSSLLADGTIGHELSARYAVSDGVVWVLEDRHGALREVEPGPLTPAKRRILASFEAAMYWTVVPTDEPWPTMIRNSDREPG